MFNALRLCIPLLLASTAVIAEEPIADEQPEEKEGVKAMSGMSILGNDEAPKSLVIVPWKSSEIGGGLSLSNVLDDRTEPVDKEVFMRELRYYEIRSNAGTEPAASELHAKSAAESP